MNPEKEYYRRHQWIDHVKQVHWKVYPCPFSCHLAFPSHSECMRHVSQRHAGPGTPQELAAMISLSEQPLDIRQGIPCPICGFEVKSARQYQSHVGRHQEQLALFALPDLEPSNESNPDEEMSDSDSTGSLPCGTQLNEDDAKRTASPFLGPEETSEPTVQSRTPQNPAPSPPRSNEYFLPRDGIDREVITSDICMYLGNDALVRPGHCEVSFDGGDRPRQLMA